MPETEDRAGPAGQQPHGAPNNETFMSNSSPRPVPAQPLGSWLSLIGTILTMLLVPEGSLTEERREEKKGLSGGILWPREILGGLLKEPLGESVPGRREASSCRVFSVGEA